MPKPKIKKTSKESKPKVMLTLKPIQLKSFWKEFKNDENIAPLYSRMEILYPPKEEEEEAEEKAKEEFKEEIFEGGKLEEREKATQKLQEEQHHANPTIEENKIIESETHELEEPRREEESLSVKEEVPIEEYKNVEEFKIERGQEITPKTTPQTIQTKEEESQKSEIKEIEEVKKEKIQLSPRSLEKLEKEKKEAKTELLKERENVQMSLEEVSKGEKKGVEKLEIREEKRKKEKVIEEQPLASEKIEIKKKEESREQISVIFQKPSALLSMKPIREVKVDFFMTYYSLKSIQRLLKRYFEEPSIDNAINLLDVLLWRQKKEMESKRKPIEKILKPMELALLDFLLSRGMHKDLSWAVETGFKLPIILKTSEDSFLIVGIKLGLSSLFLESFEAGEVSLADVTRAVELKKKGLPARIIAFKTNAAEKAEELAKEKGIPIIKVETLEDLVEAIEGKW